MTPRPSFQFLLPFVSFCGSFLRANWFACSLEHTVFATLLFLLPLIPHSWTVISSSLLVTIPSILQREEMLILTRVLSMSLALFTYCFTESLEPLFCEWYIRPILGSLEKLLACLKSQTWKVAKLGFGIFFKIGYIPNMEPNEGPEMRSWLKSPWPIHCIHEAAS